MMPLPTAFLGMGSPSLSPPRESCLWSSEPVPDASALAGCGPGELGALPPVGSAVLHATVVFSAAQPAITFTRYCRLSRSFKNHRVDRASSPFQASLGEVVSQVTSLGKGSDAIRTCR